MQHTRAHAHTHMKGKKDRRKEGRKERENMRKSMRLGMVMHVPNLSTGDFKVGELLAHGQPGLCRNFQTSLGYLCISTVYQNLERKQARKENSGSDSGKEDWQE